MMVRCDDGALAAEYSLFDVREVVLRADDPISVRESGYMTTASDALERLAALGATPEIAEQAGRAIAPDVVASFARGTWTIAALDRLGPYELFESNAYSATKRRYDGTWLDLPALADTTRIDGAAAAFQALHLAAALSEAEPDALVLLATGSVMADKRPGERSHLRISFEALKALPGALRAVRPRSQRVITDPVGDKKMIEALVQRLRARAAGSIAQVRDRIGALERTIAGPKAVPIDDHEAELTAIERQLRTGDLEGLDGRLDKVERARGRLPWVRYLRAWAALMRGDASPRIVAEELSDIAGTANDGHQSDLLAARAWLAAGEPAHARYFARRALDDAGAGESVHMLAQEILEATVKTARSHVPPPVASTEVPRIPPLPAVIISEEPRHLPGASLPPVASEPPPAPAPPPPARAPTFTLPDEPPPRFYPELVESLSLPLGADDAMLAYGAAPKTPLEVRIASTRMAREIGRDYRLRYGTLLRIDPVAIEAMQRHLRLRFANARLDDPKVVWELRRHGALLSEVLARALGAVWIDIAPTEPGHWAMHVPPRSRVWPIGRIYRFVSLGHQDRDLVSYFLELEARARGRR